ncbi:MFS transporter [Cellulosilyticum sp. I15G10I2]|uniref:MFS transporter n=1 Tax=Cellulosilyticum sp. I15G10I2 TaxID=1892843 RepID=UPI00085C4B9C|nr:MFS transporter [Cellulosilyticum sp. I15G10I2]
MATFFLIIIYMAFISLGLPDSLLGTAWPVMQIQYNAPLGAAGLISMVISGATIISSLMSGSIIKRFGTGKITFISCLMTACALLGIAISPALFWFFILAIPLGLGAGAVDSGLNNYVALHYKAHHMSWLHCFWGVGATLGPIIMSWYIGRGYSWRSGYFTVAMIQFGLVVLLFMTLPLWDKAANTVNNQSEDLSTRNQITKNDLEHHSLKEINPIHIKGVKFALASFFFYCGIEASMGLWGSSFLVNVKGLDAATAARWVSMYYGGITLGRFITGFITMKLSNKVLIRMGQSITLGGALLLLLPLPNIFSLISFIMIGLGCAPVFPCMIHETPTRFGKAYSQTIIGYQMAFAYIGITFLPPLLGWIAASTTIKILPYFALFYILGMLFSSEIINRFMKNKAC